jgi:hypothetical protein
MASAGFELQKAIFLSLTTDTALTALLGGGRIYDNVPRGAEYPYVTFGQISSRDWSTGTDEGEEHGVTLHVWSEAAGRRQTQSIVAALRDRLHDAALSLATHRLVNLQHEFSEVRREAGGEGHRGIVRFRAVTEPTA